MIFASVVIVTLPMVIAFLARAARLRPRPHRVGRGVTWPTRERRTSAENDFAGKTAVVTGAGRASARRSPRGSPARERTSCSTADAVETLEAVCAEIGAAGGSADCSRRRRHRPRSSRRADGASRPASSGVLDILVNNAGIAGPTAPLVDITLEEWNETIAVNLTGVFLACKAALPYLQRAEHGKILNIGSVTGKQPLPNRSPYAAAKLGVVGLTRTLAHEVGPTASAST